VDKFEAILDYIILGRPCLKKRERGRRRKKTKSGE
jgi:hypothetical protein